MKDNTKDVSYFTQRIKLDPNKAEKNEKGRFIVYANGKKYLIDRIEAEADSLEDIDIFKGTVGMVYNSFYDKPVKNKSVLTYETLEKALLDIFKESNKSFVAYGMCLTRGLIDYGDYRVGFCTNKECKNCINLKEKIKEKINEKTK